MTRKKVKLGFITNDSVRKATFKKRKKGLMKKVSELSTLCGIEACAIVYSPYEDQPEIWPEFDRADRVLTQFKGMPAMEQSKKMVNQESFIRHRITKTADQMKKLHRDNREKEMTHLMYQCLTGKGLHGLAVPELKDIGWLLGQNLKEIEKRIDGLKKGESSMVEQKPAVAEMGGGGVDGGAIQRAAAAVPQQQQWFTEWMGNNGGQGQMGSSFGHGGGGGGRGGGGGGVGDGMNMPFNDGGNAAMWSNVFFA